MRAFIFTVYLLLTFSAFSQDSLVYIREVQFDSPFEKEVFDNFFIKKKTDLFNLFIANGQLLTTAKIESEKAKFYAFIADLNLSKYDGKKNDKKIKAIYNDVQKKYLAKSQEIANFEEIFVTGVYNATTASILFALILEKENIPYLIKEDPNTVYLIAYPQTDRIILKPDASQTVQTFDPVFKQSFINKLKEQKIISSKEAMAGDVNTLFDQYYFGTHQDIRLTNLVGIQYMHQAAIELRLQAFDRAYQLMEKAYLYFPSERISYLMFQIGSEQLTKMESKDGDHARLLVKMSRFSRYGVTADMIKGEFGLVIQRLLFEKSDVGKLKAYYEILQQQLKSATLKSDVSYLYHYETGRFYYNQGKFAESLPFFEECIKINTSNQDAITAFIGALIQIVGEDNLKIINDFRRYANLYPVLAENNNFNSVLASAFLIQTSREYDIGSPTQGAKYQQEFESMFENNPDLNIDSRVIGNVYSVIAVYYYRKGQTAKAKSIIEKGLTYAPNSYELLARKRMIN